MIRIQAERIGFRADGEWVLRDISMDVKENTGIHILLGPNGAGKTTLMRILALLEKPLEGEVLYGGTRRSSMSIRELTRWRRRMGFVFQQPVLLRASVEENLRLVGRMRGIPIDEGKITAILARMGLDKRRKIPAHSLSGGEQQRLQLGRILVSPADILFFDEPTAGLDPLTAKNIEEEIRDISSQGKIVFISTHHLLQARRLKGKVFFLNHGRLAQEGELEEILREPLNRDIARYSLAGNIINGTIVTIRGEKILRTGASSIVLPAQAPEGPGAGYILYEDILVSAEPFHSSARNTFHGRVEEVDDLGGASLLRIACKDFSLQATITAQSKSDLSIESGREVYVTFKATAVHPIPIKDDDSELKQS